MIPVFNEILLHLSGLVVTRFPDGSLGYRLTSAVADEEDCLCLPLIWGEQLQTDDMGEGTFRIP
jgi:hypothetical protein